MSDELESLARLQRAIAEAGAIAEDDASWTAEARVRSEARLRELLARAQEELVGEEHDDG